jgi:hypothetical protein
VNDEAAARATATKPTVVGASLEQVKTELHLAARRQRGIGG